MGAGRLQDAGRSGKALVLHFQNGTGCGILSSNFEQPERKGEDRIPAIGFDNQKYLTTQSEQIKKRIAQFGGKLYLEFGGKLFDDYHASRVLPGFEPDSKIRMLQQLQDDVEILIAINAADIEKNKVRGDLGITYDDDVLRLIDIFRAWASMWAAW